MATGRERLGLSGEIHWRVPSLSLTDTTSPASNDEIAAADSVQLFCDRARLVQVGFTLGDHNARTVAAICQQLDGVPFAIELAAARLNVLRPAQVLERLSNRFGLLLGNRLAPTRQQSLHATLDWSHGLLDDVERVLLRRLAAFVGGCTLAAAEAVCGFDGLQADDILDSLAGLADKSLVGRRQHREPGNATAFSRPFGTTQWPSSRLRSTSARSCTVGLRRGRPVGTGRQPPGVAATHLAARLGRCRSRARTRLLALIALGVHRLVALIPIAAVAFGIILAPVWYLGVGWWLRRPPSS